MVSGATLVVRALVSYAVFLLLVYWFFYLCLLVVDKSSSQMVVMFIVSESRSFLFLEEFSLSILSMMSLLSTCLENGMNDSPLLSTEISCDVKV